MKERELPLIALRAFAVAARTSNLTSAAKELGVTHGAISKQVNLLERWLGQRLFTRQGRGLALTPYGQVLANKLGQALNDIRAACDYVRRDQSMLQQVGRLLHRQSPQQGIRTDGRQLLFKEQRRLIAVKADSLGGAARDDDVPTT